MANAGAVVIKIDGDDSRFKKVLSGLGKATSAAVKGITIAGTAISAAWSAVGLTSVKYIASIEQLETNFATMTGSAAKAADIMARLRKLGAETPFETEDLAATTQLLMQYGMNADAAIDRMTMLGDISQGNAEKMSRIATAYAQMSSAGKVQLEDVKQMIESGFNPLLEISERTGESMGSLYDRISKGTLAVDEITQAMQSATSEGGKFYKSMERQSQTINGMLSTIKDEAQELGGEIFEPLSDSLRSTILPEARNIIADLKAGFQAGGLDGMVDALGRQIPKLTAAGAEGASKLFGAVSKKMPSLMRGLLSGIPALLRGAVDLAPQVGDALFGVMANATEILIGQLPELAPALFQGVGRLMLSATMGVGNLVDGVFQGIRHALQELGLIGLTSDEVFGKILSDYDEEHVEELKAKINIESEVTTDTPDFKLDSLYEEIETTLTDGLADTPEIVEDLKAKVTDYYNTQISEINAWREEALANLDNTLPQAEYDAAVADINAKADQMVAGMKNASDATIAFIDENAGKATTSVQNNLGALEGIYNAAVGYRNQIAVLTGEARSDLQVQRDLVASGQERNEGSMVNAVVSEAAEKATALEKSAQIADDARAKALKEYREGSEDYSEEIERIDAEQARRDAAIEAEFAANMAALWQGISEALTPELVENMEKAQALEQLRSQMEGITGIIAEAFGDPDIATDKETMGNFITGAIGEMNLTDADYANLAQQLGIDEIDPGKIQQILIDKITGAAWGQKTGAGSELLDNLNLADFGIHEELARLYEKTVIDDGPLADILQAALESGIFTGVEGIDLSTAEGKLQLVLGQFGNESAATIGTGLAEYSFDADTETMAGNLEGSARASFDSHSPANRMKPLGNDVAAGVGAGAQEYDFNGDMLAMAQNAQSAAGSKMQAAGRRSGTYFAAGLAAGIESGRSRVITAAVRVAQAAINAVNNTLGIHSPSTVAFEAGGYFGQGFEMGVVESLNRAVRSAENIVGSMNLTPRLTAPDLTGAFTMAAQGWAEAESMRPIQLIARGRVIAETLAPDNVRANNNYNRRIALGVGKK